MRKKLTLLFVLYCPQLMEDGLTGLSGVHAVSPAVEELVKGAESVTTHHRKMVGITALITPVKLRAAMNMTVLWKVSLS